MVPALFEISHLLLVINCSLNFPIYFLAGGTKFCKTRNNRKKSELQDDELSNEQSQIIFPIPNVIVTLEIRFLICPDITILRGFSTMAEIVFPMLFKHCRITQDFVGWNKTVSIKQFTLSLVQTMIKENIIPIEKLKLEFLNMPCNLHQGSQSDIKVTEYATLSTS